MSVKFTLAEETGVKAALMVDITVGERITVGVGGWEGVTNEVGVRLADKFDWETPIFLPKFMPTKNTAITLNTKKRKMVPLAILK